MNDNVETANGKTARAGTGGVFRFLTRPDMVALALLLYGGLKIVWNINLIYDISLYDETIYLDNGVRFFAKPVTQDWAPLYSFWYFLLSFIKHDPIDLFYFNIRTLAILAPTLFYLAMRVFGVPVFFASIIAGAYLFSFGNILTMPYVSHFALMVLLVSLLISTRFKTPVSATVAVIIGALITSFVRPEFFLTFILLLAYLIWLIVADGGTKNFARYKKSIILTAGLFIFLFAVIGRPFGDGTRSMIAFSQHFAINWVKWRHSDENPWFDNEVILKRVFGDAHNMGQVVRANPAMFARHVTSNAGGVFENFYKTFFSHIETTHDDFNGFKKFETAFFLILTLGFAVAGYERYRVNLWRNIKSGLPRAVHLAAMMTPVCGSILVVFPRIHYMLMLGVFGVLLLAALFAGEREKSAPMRPRYIAAAVFCAIAVSGLFTNLYYMNSKDITLFNYRIISFIRTMDITAKVNMLEANGGYAVYLGDNFRWLPQYDKKPDEAYDKFAERNNINFIIVNDTLTKDNRYINDESWKRFYDDFASHGFIKLVEPKMNVEMLVKRGLSPKL